MDLEDSDTRAAPAPALAEAAEGARKRRRSAVRFELPTEEESHPGGAAAGAAAAHLAAARLAAPAPPPAKRDAVLSPERLTELMAEPHVCGVALRQCMRLAGEEPEAVALRYDPLTKRAFKASLRTVYERLADLYSIVSEGFWDITEESFKRRVGELHLEAAMVATHGRNMTSGTGRAVRGLPAALFSTYPGTEHLRRVFGEHVAFAALLTQDIPTVLSPDTARPADLNYDWLLPRLKQVWDLVLQSEMTVDFVLEPDPDAAILDPAPTWTAAAP